MNDAWLVGRKAICEHCGVTWRTIVNWKRKSGGKFPVKQTPGGKPAALKLELNAFLSGFDKEKKAPD